MTGGYYLGVSYLDIDSGARLSTSVSIGADQYTCVVFSASGATYTAGLLDFGTLTVNTGVQTAYLTVTNYGRGNYQIAAFEDQTYGPFFDIYNSGYDYAPPVKVNPGVAYSIPILFDTDNLSLTTYKTEVILTHNGFMNAGAFGVSKINVQATVQ